MSIDWEVADAAMWRSRREYLRPVKNIDPIRVEDLLGVDEQKAGLLRNTERFVNGKPANNALLWGSRGTGKSSLIKAVFNEFRQQGLRLIEIEKNDLLYLPEIVDEIREAEYRFIIYCDDLSFEEGESSYKALKSVLEGSIELPPDNVLIYATSNRRHLMPESMADNVNSSIINGELHYADAIEEKISLSDRFGLWLSFYPVNQTQYLAMIDHYFADFKGDRATLHAEALRFCQSKGGARSGRTAKQFYNSYYLEV
ncbi:MAG: ATP-binding protein [Gammaproteobacteria bacterium]|nr:ATP-binding protein [Gammaproteobacteria bacterium]MDH5653548.1 ATP-binding protein [Gammaproteobacteria bacterium]